MNTALLLIDIQNDYFPGGRMELVGSTEAAERAREVLEHFRKKELPVVHIQHISARPVARFFLLNTEGADIHQAVRPVSGEEVVQKHYPNSFRETTLLDALRQKGIEHLVIAGMMTHMCVDATVRAAFDAGFRCTLVRDACATRDLLFESDVVPARFVHAAFLAALSGTYARAIGSTALLSGEIALV